MINTCIISLKDTLDIFWFVIFSIFFGGWGGVGVQDSGLQAFISFLK